MHQYFLEIKYSSVQKADAAPEPTVHLWSTRTDWYSLTPHTVHCTMSKMTESGLKTKEFYRTVTIKWNAGSSALWLNALMIRAMLTGLLQSSGPHSLFLVLYPNDLFSRVCRPSVYQHLVTAMSVQNSHAHKINGCDKSPKFKSYHLLPWLQQHLGSVSSANLAEWALREFELTEMMSSNYSENTQMKKSSFTASAWTGTMRVCQATGITVIYSA